MGWLWESGCVRASRTESDAAVDDVAAAGFDASNGGAVPLAVLKAGPSAAAVLALQRAAGNAATVAALRGQIAEPQLPSVQARGRDALDATTAQAGGAAAEPIPPPSMPVRRLSRDLWGDLAGAASSAWDTAGEVAEKAAAALAKADPLRASFDFNSARMAVQDAAAGYVGDKTTERRLRLIRAVKRMLRGATPEQLGTVRQDLGSTLGATEADGIWQESETAFGGYTGMYPGYARDVKGLLEKLGASETLPFGTFELQRDGPAEHRSDAERIAAGELSELARTDILFFRGHQFAQYRAPGVFSDGSQTYGFDLRYLEKVGGFGNVKLLISTSCATLCGEAFEVFHNLFPNAVILGYRRSAPRFGEKVRKALSRHIKAIRRPLLLEEAVDLWAITRAWRAVIEERHAGDTEQLPGYYDGSTIHYWDGSDWGTISPGDEANTCSKKRNFSDVYPAPAPASSA